jgi:Uma2 family endonuclease
MDAVNMPRTPKLKKFSLEEFVKFTKDKKERYELIEGMIHMMASPSMDHQDITGFIYRKLGNYLEGKPCKAFIAPFDVFLFKKPLKNECQNVFQPDVFVVCKKNKMSQRGIYGAPDFVVEVTSSSNAEHDYIDKLNVYMRYGVREYWIVNPETRQIYVYAKGKRGIISHSFEDKIKVGIFDDFAIDFSELRI